MREKPVNRVCPHRAGAWVDYVNNDGVSPPVILVEGLMACSVISLTNQTIRISCPACFAEIRKGLSISKPGTVSPPS